MQERALAGAGGAHDGGEAAAADPDRDAVESDDGACATAVDLADVIEPDGVEECMARRAHGLGSGLGKHGVQRHRRAPTRDGPGPCPALLDQGRSEVRTAAPSRPEFWILLWP